MSAKDGMTPEHKAALQQDLALVGELLALPSVERHDTRFEHEIALVAPHASLDQVCGVVERRLLSAVKPPDQQLPQELQASALVEAMGGVHEDQTLYLKRIGDRLSLYVAFWPWSGGQRFTIKIGVHVETD